MVSIEHAFFWILTAVHHSLVLASSQGKGVSNLQSNRYCRAIAFENQEIIMEVQEEIISSWWVQGKALLKMCG
ncbi:hypothetical protein, partial [Candidatus Magnetaquicoccus inordinatus]|uniref:hypothetical protein n=1 Tax=Candidatus Magnetaquicoccus inordinatus TaxID=2496818 RepID=UPI001D0F3057